MWTASAGSIELSVLLTGLVISCGIGATIAASTRVWDIEIASPSQVLSLLRYAGAFARELVRSNLKLLGYVYAPRVRLAPATQTIGTELTSPMARLTLTSTITLTPGTLSLDLAGDAIRLHVLDADFTDPDQARETVSGPFEAHLARALG